MEEGKKLIDAQAIQIGLKKDTLEKLYIEITCENGTDRATVIISGGHTNFVFIAHNDHVLLDKRTSESTQDKDEVINLNLRKVYNFATTCPLEEISFILEAKRLNKQAAERSFEGSYGHELGKT